MKNKILKLKQQQNLEARQDALYKLRADKESQILNQVQAAAKSSYGCSKLDAILSDQVVFAGGVDVTNLLSKS